VNRLAILIIVVAISLLFVSCTDPIAPITPIVDSKPDAPTGVSAISGNAQATVSWASVTGATSYNLYWSTTSGVTPLSGTKNTGVASPYTQKALTNGTTYFYVVTAVNGSGESPASSQASAIPFVPATNLLINEIGNAHYTGDSCAVELYNPTSASVNLANYHLKTGSRTNDETTTATFPDAGVRTFTLPTLTIASHGYAVIRARVTADQESGGMTVYLDDGALTNPHYPWISDSTGFVELQNSAGSTVDFVRYGSSVDSPSSSSFAFTGTAPAFTGASATVGASLARNFSWTTTQSAADWSGYAWNSLGGGNDVTTDNASDGDGVPDSAKTVNATLAGLPLYAWGARSGQKDIFIHISYMVNSSLAATDPGLIPRKEALDKVVAAFLTQGYHLHFDVGTLFSLTPGDTANYNLDGTDHRVPYVVGAHLGKLSGYANAIQYKSAYMSAAKRPVFYYMLFAYNQTSPATVGGSGGIAYLWGSTSIITLGTWGLTTAATSSYTAAQNTAMLVNWQAATVMHEFGHNLGLRHGGDENTNYKPNYFSIMNYLYQLGGLPTTSTGVPGRYYSQYWDANGAVGYSGATSLSLNTVWQSASLWSNWGGDSPLDANFKIDYSHGLGAQLVESTTNDNAGILQPSLTAAIAFAASGSGYLANHSLDILQLMGSTGTVIGILHDYNDWGGISSVFQRSYLGYNLGTLAPTARSRSSVVSATVDPRSILNNSNPETSGPCPTLLVNVHGPNP